MRDDGDMDRPEPHESPAPEASREVPEATAIARLAERFAGLGVGAGSTVVVGLRAGLVDDTVRAALEQLGAAVVDIDPSRPRAEGEALLARDTPSFVVADTLLYLAGANWPLRGYLRRRGFEVPDLRRVDARHVRLGRRWPLLVPRSIRLEDLMSDTSA